MGLGRCGIFPFQRQELLLLKMFKVCQCESIYCLGGGREESCGCTGVRAVKKKKMSGFSRESDTDNNFLQMTRCRHHWKRSDLDPLYSHVHEDTSWRLKKMNFSQLYIVYWSFTNVGMVTHSAWLTQLMIFKYSLPGRWPQHSVWWPRKESQQSISQSIPRITRSPSMKLRNAKDDNLHLKPLHTDLQLK